MSTRIAPVFLISLIFGCATTDGAGGVSSSEGDRPAAGSAGAGATSGGAGGGGNESGGSAGDGGSDPGGMGGGENAGAGGNGGTAPTTGGTGGQAGAAGSAGSGGSGGTPNPLAGECPIDVEGPRLVKVWSRAGGVFCIDSTEVLRDQYRKFIDDNVPVDSTGDCSWNSTYTPLQAASGQCSSGEWPNNASNFNHPVVCVDWCDAKSDSASASPRTRTTTAWTNGTTPARRQGRSSTPTARDTKPKLVTGIGTRSRVNRRLLPARSRTAKVDGPASGTWSGTCGNGQTPAREAATRWSAGAGAVRSTQGQRRSPALITRRVSVWPMVIGAGPGSGAARTSCRLTRPRAAVGLPSLRPHVAATLLPRLELIEEEATTRQRSHQRAPRRPTSDSTGQPRRSAVDSRGAAAAASRLRRPSTGQD